MADVAMPRLSDSMEEGTILKWLKSDGDEVKRGEELVEIETDKANMTYEADQDGALEIVAKEGDTLPVGETIARIGEGRGRRRGRRRGGAEDEAEPSREERASRGATTRSSRAEDERSRRATASPPSRAEPSREAEPPAATATARTAA